MTAETESTREVLIALSNPVAGKEAEFKDWYWGTHIPEVLTLEPFVSAQSYALAPNEASPYQYATVYQIEGSAVDARNLLFSGVVGMSDVIDLTVMMTAPFGAPVSFTSK